MNNEKIKTVILNETKLRPYQNSLIAKCMKGNAIILLPTGTGKTLIAFTVIKNLINDLKGTFPGEAKRTVFLAPTKILVEQQQREFSKFSTDLDIESVFLHGDCGADFFTPEEWHSYFRKYHVFFFTPQIFLDIITKNFISYDQLNILIIDECHHISKIKGDSNHPYKNIMDLYKFRTATSKIIGLTASLFNSITLEKFEKNLAEIEKNYEAKIFSEDTTFFIKNANTYVIPCENSLFPIMIENIMKQKNISSNISFDDLLKEAFNFSKDILLDIDDNSKYDFFLKINEIIHVMGPWFAIEGLKMVLENLNNSTLSTNIFIIENIKNIQKILFEAFPLLEDRLNLINDKIKILFKIINSFESGTPTIVFIKEKIIANVLYRYIDYCSKNGFFGCSNILPGFFIGRSFSTSKLIKHDLNTEDIYTSIENGSLNFLISTSVLEEGIDIPTCSLVIRYDFPENFRSYIQSRGRSRFKDSIYFLMADMNIDLARQKLCEYNQIEEKLNKYRADDEILNIVDMPNFCKKKYETSTGAILLQVNSKQLLCKYIQKCSSLPSNHFFINEFINDDGYKMFICAFWYPSLCPIFGFEISDIFARKDYAEIDCAFNACVRLIEAGEIDSYLCIKKIDTILESHYNELNLKIKTLQDENQFNLKTDNYEQVNSEFSKQLKAIKPLSSTVKQHLFSLYCVDFGDYSKILIDKNVSMKFGILSPIPFKFDKFKFPLCCNQTEIEISIYSISQYRLSLLSQEYKDIKFFTNHILKWIIANEFDFKWKTIDDLKNEDENENENESSSSSSFFSSNICLVPLNNDNNDIDFDIIKKIYNWKKLMIEKNYDLKNIVQDIENKDDGYFDEKIIFTYAHNKNILFYSPDGKIKKNSKDFMKKDITFEQYYYDKYNITIDGDLHHMEELTKTLKIKKLHINKQVGKKINKESIGYNYFSLKTAVIYPLSFSQMIMFNAWTFINYRIEQYMKAYDFLDIFKKQMNINYSENMDIFSRNDQILINQKLNIIKNIRNSSEKYQIINIENIKKLQNYNDCINISSLLDFQNFSINHDQLEKSISRKEMFDLLKFSTFGMATCFIETNINNSSLSSPSSSSPSSSSPSSSSPSSSSPSSPSSSIEDVLNFNNNINNNNNKNNNNNIQKKSIFTKHSKFILPDPILIVQALTISKAGDVFDNEQLETLGDAFLKMTTCLFLYFKYPKYSEGKLTALKSIIVSNQNLFQLAIEKKIFKYIFANVLNIGTNWTSPFYNDNILQKQELKYKNIADCVEALFGTFFIYGSFDALLFLFDWFGLNAFDPSNFSDFDPIKHYQNEIHTMIHEAKKKDELKWYVKQFENFNPYNMIEQEYEKFCFSKVEQIIGYTFKNKFYLIQAFTHSSFSSFLKDSNNLKRKLVECNERLEFIGDGILDFLIILKIYQTNNQLRPCDLTHLKSALVNNSFFASLIIKFGLHHFLRYSDRKITDDINIYVDYFKESMKYQQCRIFKNAYNDMIEVVESPKILSDIFEALVGAIYIDIGFDLEQLWEIVLPLIRPEFEYCLENIPKNPVSLMSQKFAGRFQYETEICEPGVKVILSIYKDDQCNDLIKKFIAFSSNSRLGRLAAAQKCLSEMSS